jgi:hypothetical protein
MYPNATLRTLLVTRRCAVPGLFSNSSFNPAPCASMPFWKPGPITDSTSLAAGPFTVIRLSYTVRPLSPLLMTVQRSVWYRKSLLTLTHETPYRSGVAGVAGSRRSIRSREVQPLIHLSFEAETGNGMGGSCTLNSTLALGAIICCDAGRGFQFASVNTAELYILVVSFFYIYCLCDISSFVNVNNVPDKWIPRRIRRKVNCCFPDCFDWCVNLNPCTDIICRLCYWWKSRLLCRDYRDNRRQHCDTLRMKHHEVESIFQYFFCTRLNDHESLDRSVPIQYIITFLSIDQHPWDLAIIPAGCID